MVVIKSKLESLNSQYPARYMGLLNEFSNVIGYSIELDDEVRIEFNPDRPDLFSFPTLIRAMKIYYDRDFIIRNDPSRDAVSVFVDKSALKIRPFFYSFTATGNRISGFLHDLIEFQEKIHESIGKNRSKVSIGIHDLDNVSPPFYYKAHNKDTVFETYDGFRGTASEILDRHPKGIQYSGLLNENENVPLITDSEGNVLSMPPIVNGSKSKLSDDTRRFFVDLTGNDPVSIKYAFYLLKNFFESLNYRVYINNINGIDGKFENVLLNFNWRGIQISIKEIKEITGNAIERENAIVSLRRMGYVAEPSERGILVYVPGQRTDVMGPVDIIEDIIKSEGIENITENELPVCTAGKPAEISQFLENSRDVMVGLGFQEVMSFVLAGKIYENGYSGGVILQNPKSDDFSIIRDRLYPNLLALLQNNKNRPLPQRIFEIGETIENAVQHTKLSVMLSNYRASYSDIKGVLDSYILRFSNDKGRIVENHNGWMIDGHGGSVILKGRDIGIIGEIHPSVLETFELTNPVAFYEIDLKTLMNLVRNL